VRRQALHSSAEPTESVDSVADRPQALPAAWWPVMAARAIWGPHAGAGPARQASTASKPPARALTSPAPTHTRPRPHFQPSASFFTAVAAAAPRAPPLPLQRQARPP